MLKNNPPEEFINRIAKERIELKKRQKDRTLKLKQKLKTKEEIQAEKSKELLEKKKQERLQEYEKLKEKRVQEKQTYDPTNSPVHNVKTPLYKKLEDKYRKRLMPELERKKMVLRSIRDMHKPLDHEEIMNHARKYSQERKEEIEHRRQERENKIKNDENSTFGRHKSMFLESIQARETDNKRYEMMRSLEKQELKDKMLSYGKMVKEMHKPIISRKKQVELEIAKAKLKHKPRVGIMPNSRSVVNKMSNSSTKTSEIGDDDKHPPSPTNSIHKSEYRSYFTENKKLRPLRRWRENDMLPKPKPKRVSKASDWLLQRRLKTIQDEENEIIGKDSTIRRSLDWRQLVDKFGKGYFK